MSQTISVISGDGIGPEVSDATVRVIEAAGGRVEWDEQLAGKVALERYGTPLPDALFASIRKNKVALKGPIETKIGLGFRSVNVALRQFFDLYANVRPIQSLPKVKSPFSEVDLVVVRANEEEIMAHEAMLEKLRAAGDCVWDRTETDSQAAK